MGENICKWYDQQGANIQNIWMAHTTQYQQTNDVIGSGQKMWIEIFPKKTYRWLVGTWKDAQHH